MAQQLSRTAEEKRLAQRAAEKRYRLVNPEKIKKRKALYHKNNRDKGLAQSKKWASANPDKVKNNMLKYHFDITLEQYNQMFKEQKGCCAICKIHQSELKQSLSVDHNHETDKVRALLCNKCNMAIGLLKEDIIILEQAIKYLKYHV